MRPSMRSVEATDPSRRQGRLRPPYTASRPAIFLIGLAALAFAGAGSAQLGALLGPAEPAEVAPFRMTGIEGFVEAGYWRNATENEALVGGESITNRQTLTNLSGKLFVMTHSYVYHPNLLLLDLGLGPDFFRTGYAANGPETTSDRSVWDAKARATFLKEKPYRGSIFYERTNDASPVGPAQTLLTQNTRYGFDAAWLQPATSVPLRLDANRFRSQGRGTDQVIDEKVDELNFRADRSWGKLGDSHFHYQAIDDDSKSGSLGLPILETRTRSQLAELDTSLAFGSESRYTLTNNFSWYTQSVTGDQGVGGNRDVLSDTNQLRFDLNLQGRPTDTLQTHARYQFDSLDQSGGPNTLTARVNGLQAGLAYQPTQELGGTLDATATYNRSSVFNAGNLGLSGTVNYVYKLPVGELATNYGFAWLRRDQNATQASVPAIGERVTLSGTAWVSLAKPYVVPGSVVVSNLPRTQTYVEGLDYALQVIGQTTQIQRLVGGNIVDGETVLVDYEFDSGGTFVLREFDNNVGLAWRYKSLLSSYVRYYDTAPRIVSGNPTTPINPVKDTIFGVRADLPVTMLNEEFTFGGFAEWENRDESISPYRRATYEAYADLPLWVIARGGLHVGARQQKTEYDLQPDQNVTQNTLNLRLWARIRGGPSLSIDATRTRSLGLPQVTSTYTQGIARAVWRIRRVLMTLEYNLTRTEQLGVRQTQSLGQLKLRRDF